MTAPGFAFDALKLRVTYGGQPLDLTPLRTRMLALVLANDDGATVDELMGLGIASVGALRVHMTHIRGALPDGHRLANRYGTGYILTRQ